MIKCIQSLAIQYISTYNVVSPGCSLCESVMAVVIGRSGSCSEGAARKSNLFNSEAHSLKDDDGEPIGPHDFKRGVYAELVGLYTSPSDWVLNLSTQSGKYNNYTCTYYLNSVLTECLL